MRFTFRVASFSFYSALGALIFIVSTANSSSAAPKKVFDKIINGQRSSNSSVVEILIETDQDEGLCTGSIISSTAILTAWHCVVDDDSNVASPILPAKDFFVHAGGKVYSVSAVHAHPQIAEDDTGLLTNDVAILFLRSAIRNITPLTILTSKSVRAGSSMTIYGYGASNGDPNADPDGSGSQRRGQTTVESVDSQLITGIYNGHDADTCFGDSGGPAIFTYRDSKGKSHTGIVGSTSTGSSDNCGVGDETTYVSMQSKPVLQFLKAQVRGLKTS